MEKYVELLGEEKKGYCKEKVDKYVSRLEQIATKLQQEYKALKQQIDAAPPTGNTENFLEQITALRSANDRLLDENKRLAASVDNRPPIPAEDFSQEVVALRNENDRLLDENKKLTASLNSRPKLDMTSIEEQQQLIGQTIISAQSFAEEIKFKAKKEAERIVFNSQIELSSIKDEKEKVYQGIADLYISFSNFYNSLSNKEKEQ